MWPNYPLPIGLGARLAIAIMLRKHINFAQQARSYSSRLGPQIVTVGTQNIPRTGPCLITINHYSRTGFRSWWLAISVSAAVPVDIRWIITNAWTFPDKVQARFLTPITDALFPQIAWCLDFSTMPPMPPRPQDLERRSQGVRSVLHDTRRILEIGEGDQLMIGLAPEGGDTPGGALAPPPPGAGRFIEQLARMGLVIVPVGIYEESGRLCLNFGAGYNLSVPSGISKHERDRDVSWLVMEQIATLVPEQLGYRYR